MTNLEPDDRHETIEDLLQEVWLRLARHAKNGDPTRKFSTWLFTIAANLAHNEHRNRKRRFGRLPLVRNAETGDTEEFDPPDTAPRADELCEHRDTLEQLTEFLADNTSDDNARTLEMRAVQGFTYEEIARVTGVPVGTVKSRLSRGREAARAFLKAQT